MEHGGADRQRGGGQPGRAGGIQAGDVLVSINGHDIVDVLDYRFFETERELRLCLTRGGEPYQLELVKPQYASLGLEFATYLMDEQRSCRNKCIFCFIDQLPKGMRETLYFKDDDDRLSFLFGNYITLTNIDDREVDRILQMRISPINVSVHTMDPQLRCKMMHNRFAGVPWRHLYRLAEGASSSTARLCCAPASTTAPPWSTPCGSSGPWGRGSSAWPVCRWDSPATGRACTPWSPTTKRQPERC